MGTSAGRGSASRRRARRRAGDGCSEDMVLLAASLATQLTRGRRDCEIETMINLIDVLQDTLVGILQQRRILNRQQMEVLQDIDYIP